jgi:hypothetical protein
MTKSKEIVQYVMQAAQLRRDPPTAQPLSRNWRTTGSSSGVSITPTNTSIPHSLWALAALTTPKPSPAKDRVVVADDS